VQVGQVQDPHRISQRLSSHAARVGSRSATKRPRVVDRGRSRKSSIASDEKNSRVHLVHKAAILKLSDGRFLDVANAVAGEYPYIEVLSGFLNGICRALMKC